MVDPNEDMFIAWQAYFDDLPNVVLDEYLGEQPVGTSLIVETSSDKHLFLAHTPTMRVPLSIQYTDNIYLAMWSMLLAVRKHNQLSDKKINIVACPGLGTGYGRVPFTEAARQMVLAYKHFLHPPERIDWAYAELRQEKIRFGGATGFVTKMD